jgi:hypothetical protein
VAANGSWPALSRPRFSWYGASGSGCQPCPEISATSDRVERTLRGRRTLSIHAIFPATPTELLDVQRARVEGKSSASTQASMHRLIHPGIPVAALVCGITYLVVSYIYEIHFLRDLLTGLSNAAVILGFLGLTLEPVMRRAFARDVFLAAFGYHLPEDFKAEIARIASHRVICVKHIMDVKIQEIDSECVRVTTLIERRFENISVTPILWRGTAHVDEWGFSEPTRILRCEIFDERSGRRKQFNPNNVELEGNRTLKARSPQMICYAGKPLTVLTETSEIRRKNDHTYIVFMTPTRRPEIRIIEKPIGLEADADFGNGKKAITLIPYRYELEGVYFPPSPMRVRWWPKVAN